MNETGNPSKKKAPRAYIRLILIILSFLISFTSFYFYIFDIILGRENWWNWLIICALITAHALIELIFYISLVCRDDIKKVKSICCLGYVMLKINDFYNKCINSKLKKGIVLLNYFIRPTLFFLSFFEFNLSPNRSQQYEVITFECVVFCLKLIGAADPFGLVLLVLIKLFGKNKAKIEQSPGSMNSRQEAVEEEKKEEEKENNTNYNQTPLTNDITEIYECDELDETKSESPIRLKSRIKNFPYS
ncbi:unnamed protein product [Blepharisma stoltei]|uniref:Transmembrane protein n=1 Tax=Blepharisma stoltei TaxID=1481888 RepID=A0AAU9JDI6_9CILI|nr:unnamed protein product [Blepharisma stoltei]